MAPALSVPPREIREHGAAQETEKQITHRRRALASVDNLSTHMEEDDMGLQNQPSLAKDSQEMEQILSDLGSNDLAQADLLQAIKTLEGGDALSTGDTDAIFPLSGFDLNETADSEGDLAEEKIKQIQTKLERRCSFLQRRLRLLQTRAIGKRVSEEAAQSFEKCTRGTRKDGGGRPMGLKAMLKKIETTAALQASAASRSVVGPKYFHAGTSRGDASRSASIGIPSGTLTGLQDTAGALRSHLSVVRHGLDSDATASSSGAESNDEAVVYNNPHQQPMPIEKRALWQYQRARSSLASRWTWLQAQMQELDYKIRQHKELYRQIREAKGGIEFEGEPQRAEGSQPNAEPEGEASETCARLRPLCRETFKKRKLLQMHNLHIATVKAAKPSDIRCSCRWPADTCSVCTGRGEPTEPAAPPSTLSASQRVGAADPAHHPALSLPADIPPSVHTCALTSRAWFRSRCNKTWRGAHHAGPRAHAAHSAHAAHGAHAAQAAPTQHTPKSTRRHQPPRKRGRPPLSRKIRERGEREEDTSTSSQQESRRPGRPSTESRRRPSYDIDNIVIPQSVAASTRPQILTYKEIITPKWRVRDIPEASLNNGVVKTNSRSHRISVESEEEDISDPAVRARHSRAEVRERTRYTRTGRPRREPLIEPLAEQLIAPAPPTPPAPVDQPENVETVRPYSPRQFPLRDDTYFAMVSAMPEGYRAASPPPTPPRLSDSEDMEVDGSSTLSPLSPTPYDGDDPDDAEWDPNSERVERRKSAFR